MAERRMFAKTIVLSDAFLDMPLSARCLYFTLGMFADDDGFVNSPKGIMRQCGASEDDLKVLLTKKFLLSFESGVIVIKHWRINNYLRNDRYQVTKYTDEKATLTLDENGAYSFGIPNSGIPSIGKDSIDKDINISCAFSDEKHDTLNEFFESIWKLYPIKKGKGQVSKAKKQALQKIGYEQIKRCVDRFVEDMESSKRDKQYWMHGSTFFNSGYVDYLDSNYEQGGTSDAESCSVKLW